jgi:hypothetical protein
LHGPSVLAVRPGASSSPRAQQMAGYIIMYTASHHLLAHNHKAAANADLQNQRERRQSRQSGSPPLVVQTSSSLVCWHAGSTCGEHRRLGRYAPPGRLWRSTL